MAPSVLFVAPSAYPLGGVADWLDYLLPGLASGGWRCTLALTAGVHHDAAAYLEAHPWPRVREVSNRTGSPEGRVRALARTIARDGADVVVVANVVDTYAAVRRLRRSGRSAPRVVTALHGLQQDLFDDIEAERDVIDVVAATNRLASALACKSLRDSARVHYTPCGVSAAPAPTRRFRGRAPTLLFAGRLEEEQKRVLDLVALAATLRSRNVEFVIDVAGDGPDGRRLQHSVLSAGLGDHFRWLGTLGRAALAQAYRTHDALLITSAWETGPLVAWEAMGHGLPLITSDYVGSGLEGALEHDTNCLKFPVGDMTAAADSVQRLAREPALGSRLAAAGRSLVEARYGIRNSVDHWDRALRAALSLPERPLPGARTASAPAGRLDRCLGETAAETARLLLGRRFLHTSPGGEWPHTAHARREPAAFLSDARRLDAARV